MKSSLSSAGVLVVVVVVLAITVTAHSLTADLPFPARLVLYSIATLVLFAVVYKLTTAVTYWRRTEEAYRLIFEDASDAIVIASPALKIVEVNGRATEVFGYSRQDLLGMNLKDLLQLEDRAPGPVKLERVLGEGETALYERRFRRPDGETITAEVGVRALRDGRLIAIDAKTGKPYYQQERLPKPYSFKSSPVGANGKLYLRFKQGLVCYEF